MAEKASSASSSSYLVHQHQGGRQYEDGSDTGWVEARTHCDHLPPDLLSPSPHPSHMPPPDSPCARCDNPRENWLCLTCKHALCSRFVNQHMLEHFQETDHCVALSYSDLSVWCFKCDAYLDAQAILPLRPVYEIVHLLKFGVRPPFRAVESL